MDLQALKDGSVHYIYSKGEIIAVYYKNSEELTYPRDLDKFKRRLISEYIQQEINNGW